MVTDEMTTELGLSDIWFSQNKKMFMEKVELESEKLVQGLWRVILKIIKARACLFSVEKCFGMSCAFLS